MKHAREDYDRFQDPAADNPSAYPGVNPIGADEPVFILRARDIIAPGIVEEWADRLEASSGNPVTVERVRDWADTMRAWQDENGAKVPDYVLDDVQLAGQVEGTVIDRAAEAGAAEVATGNGGVSSYAPLVSGQRVVVQDGRAGEVRHEVADGRYHVELDGGEGFMIVGPADVTHLAQPSA